MKYVLAGCAIAVYVGFLISAIANGQDTTAEQERQIIAESVTPRVCDITQIRVRLSPAEIEAKNGQAWKRWIRLHADTSAKVYPGSAMGAEKKAILEKARKDGVTADILLKSGTFQKRVEEVKTRTLPTRINGGGD